MFEKKQGLEGKMKIVNYYTEDLPIKVVQQYSW